MWDDICEMTHTHLEMDVTVPTVILWPCTCRCKTKLDQSKAWKLSLITKKWKDIG